jgi:tetratricopeptide (TPR) repeat protein
MAETHGDLGTAVAIRGRLAEAAESLRRAVALAPGSADAHSQLGTVLMELGRFDEAAASLRQAIEANPDHPTAAATLGYLYSTRGRFAELAAVCRPLARIRPGHMVVQLRLGEALVHLGELDEAINCFEAALGLSPESPEAHLGLGLVMLSLGRFEAALPNLARAIELGPDRPESHALLERALRGLGRLDEALECAERVLRLLPEDAQAHCVRGFLLDELRRCDEALTCFDQAIRLDPRNAEAHHNRGVVLVRLTRYDEAIAAFDEAIRLVPDYDEARGNRARALLTLGHFDRGWEEFERQVRHRNPNSPGHSRRLWMGEPLIGRTILLHAEQGLGDTVQFMRYIAQVKVRGGRVLFVCPQPLVRLAATCPGIDQVVPRGDRLPEFDIHSPLMRLMSLFSKTVEAIPAPIPYLSADAARVERWRERLAGPPALKVGIAWQGNPKHKRDRDRSFPLVNFERLAAIHGVRLFNLQKGFGADQIRELAGRFPLVELGDELDPDPLEIRDTPAVMMGLDLVITPDSMLAHLAGALGIPVWIALPFSPDWRWLLGRDDSPWYPTARLFRQREPGRWDLVFDRIARALEELIALQNY